MLKSKIFLISLLISVLMLYMTCCFEDCKSPTSPDPDPWNYGGEIEILLETDREVDFTKTAISVYHVKYGGKNASYWIPASEDNKWIAVISLNCDPQPYFLLATGYNLNTDKFYLKRKGDTEWLRLICIVDHLFDSRYKALKFLFNNGQLQNPGGC